MFGASVALSALTKSVVTGTGFFAVSGLLMSRQRFKERISMEMEQPHPELFGFRRTQSLREDNISMANIIEKVITTHRKKELGNKSLVEITGERESLLEMLREECNRRNKVSPNLPSYDEWLKK